VDSGYVGLSVTTIEYAAVWIHIPWRSWHT